MRCPFIKEAQVKYCQNSAFRKLILRKASNGIDEKCSTRAYAECSIYQQRVHDEGYPACPYLAQQLVQFCAAAPVAKFIPYSESVLSRCGTEKYRYCELYLSLAEPGIESGTPSYSPDCPREWIEGIRVPEWLYYSPNHMWLDVSSDGCCHIGVDAFLIRALGTPDRVNLLTPKGLQHPKALLSIRGVDLEVSFPNRMMLTGSNLYLRANPGKMAADPYTIGWLFEGAEATPGHGSSVGAGLMRGERALEWMQKEVERLSAFVHEQLPHGDADHTYVMDGGSVGDALAQHLSREQILALYDQFFSPHASWTRWQ